MIAKIRIAEIGSIRTGIVKVGVATLGLLLSAALCGAQDTCPWINAATVIDAPNASVSDVQGSVANNGNLCAFHYRKADDFYNVQIAIHAAAGNSSDMAADEARCKSGKMDLPHIGNEAVLCSTGAHGERVIGRVRDKIFVINIDVKAGHDSTDRTKSLGDMATMMAAQVAGNLF